jgi:hypothetical protein
MGKLSDFDFVVVVISRLPAGRITGVQGRSGQKGSRQAAVATTIWGAVNFSKQ